MNVQTGKLIFFRIFEKIKSRMRKLINFAMIWIPSWWFYLSNSNIRFFIISHLFIIIEC